MTKKRAHRYCTRILHSHFTRKSDTTICCSSEGLRSLSPKALLPLSDFDRREIALNAITSAVRFEGRKTKTERYARVRGWLRGEGGSVVSFQGGWTDFPLVGYSIRQHWKEKTWKRLRDEDTGWCVYTKKERACICGRERVRNQPG